MSYIEIRTGSDSDIPRIKEAYEFLDALQIPYTPRILSAHRTPDVMAKKAQELESEGFRVSIGAAGGSAHLPGMTASETFVPVIALPVRTSTLDGVDSLYSMVQMPNGIPVGCVGIGDAKAAAELAVKIAYLFEKIEVERKPSVAVLTNSSEDLSLFDQLGISYELNPEKLTHPVVLVVDELSSITLPDVKQPVIAAPLASGIVPHEEIVPKITGSVAWVGVNRVKNGILYAAAILGLYFPEVRQKLEAYRNELKQAVGEKNAKLQKLGLQGFL